MTYYWVERRLEFKTVPARWATFGYYETLDKAEAAVQQLTEILMKEKAEGHQPKAKGGGTITEYRVYGKEI